MATSLQISIVEYLNADYRPDREYLDGEVVERNLGKWEHARVQALLTIWFGQHEEKWKVQTATGWVSEARVRIPDLVVVGLGTQPEVLERPPVLLVEILSPGDTYSDTQSRAQDYLRMGVQTIWILDPETRSARICTGRSWTGSSRLEVPGTSRYLDVDALYSQLGSSAR